MLSSLNTFLLTNIFCVQPKAAWHFFFENLYVQACLGKYLKENY